MSEKLSSIRQTAQYYRIAEIRVWELIQQEFISTKIKRGIILVDRVEIDSHFVDYPEKLELWQKNFNLTQNNKTRYE